jgi:predicted DsbA family dithiol-disulfide isomerase
MASEQPIAVDVVSDVVCPWCYVGKRRLEAAIAQLPNIDVDVRWHPFQLDSTIPKSGKDRHAYLTDKFGPDKASDMHRNLEKLGAAEGIEFAFDKIKVSPNTLDCHRLILWSRADELQSEIVERLFQVYFQEGGDLSKPETLVRVAEEVGMQSDLVEQLFETDSDLEKTKAHIARAQEMGVTGVPCFIIDGRFVIAGAEKAETLAAAIQHAEETRVNEPEEALDS